MAAFPYPLFVVRPEEGGGVSPKLLATVAAALDTREDVPPRSPPRSRTKRKPTSRSWREQKT